MLLDQQIIFHSIKSDGYYLSYFKKALPKCVGLFGGQLTEKEQSSNIAVQQCTIVL